MTFSRTIASLAVLAMLAAPAAAQEGERGRPHERGQQSGERGEASPSQAGAIFSLIPADAVSDHVLKSSAGDIPYTATAGTLDLFGQDGSRTARVFYTAYVAKERSEGRPITFAFNGGPGAASAYLHLGLVGPKILDFSSGPEAGAEPKLSDNPDSWLRFTDLVLIDAIGTGWSRAASDDIARGFYGVRQDAEMFAKTIALYVQKNDRLGTPKYLLGESYGGFRAVKTALALKNSQGILVSGIVMMSPLTEGRFLANSSDPLSAALQLPSLAAARMDADKTFTPEKLAEAEKFAMSDYLVALAGPALQSPAADTLYRRVADLTDIREEDVARSRGFVGDIYAKDMAGPGRIVSPYDASYSAPDAYPEDRESRNDDPILDGYTRAYGAAFAAYARHDLGFACDVTYTLLNDEVNRRWEWNGSRGGDARRLASVETDIRDLLSTIPSFHLMIAHGHADALTPYGVSRYVLDHLPETLAKGRTALKTYPGGHMFYAQTDARRDFSADALDFYRVRIGD